MTSCEQDAPVINFTQTDTHISDYSGIIQALSDQSKSMEEKLSLIETAINNQSMTISEKADVLNAAVENGVFSLNEMTEKLYDVLTAQTETLEEEVAGH